MMPVKRLYLGAMLFFMYAPIFVLMVFSFNASRSRNAWDGFTFYWYLALFEDPAIGRALWNTLVVAVLSTLAAVAIGTTAAVGISKMGRRTSGAVMGVTKLPVMMPDIVTGISLRMLYLFIFGMAGFGSLGLGTLLFSHIVFNVPYVILCVIPKLRQLDPNLYEAALDLGSSPPRAFAQVVLPEIWPGVVTGAMLAFTLSVDDFMVSFFTTSPAVQNLSTLIFSMTRRGVNPRINALSTIMFVAIMLMLFLIYRRDKKQAESLED